MILAFVVVGAAVASRRPRNAVGWILLAEGLLWLVPLVAAAYVGRALFAEPGSLPAARFVAWLLNTAVLLASIVSFVLGFREARGQQRQQFEWLVYATAVLVAGLTLGEVLSALSVPDSISSNFNIIPLIGLPVGVGFAILQHRPYDIDRIINRTLVYGVLTALLGAVYAIGVVLLPQLLGRTSPLLVAGSTLVAAALFQPLHRPVQDLVDRRFSQRKIRRGQDHRRIQRQAAAAHRPRHPDLRAVRRGQADDGADAGVGVAAPPAERDGATQPSD